jgi:methyl-accepting chemotaxis protein
MTENLSNEQHLYFFAEIKEKSDRRIANALVAYFLFGIFLAFFYNTFTIALCVGGLCLIAYFSIKIFLPNSLFYQYIGSAALAVFAAQFIYQMHGLFEMHFFVFIGMVLLVTYQNWKLQLPLVILVIIQLASFGYLQNSGAKEIYFSQLDHVDIQALLFHGALAAVVSAICGYWSYDLAKKTEGAAWKALGLERQLKHVNNNIAFSNEISKGNLTVEYTLLDDSDALGKSLLSMRENLIRSATREQDERFITLGITKVGEIIQKNNDNAKKLAEEFIIGIIKYLGINQGGIFLYEEEDHDRYLNLVASYAYERKKFLTRRIEIGEGLVGQCFLEKEPIYMTEIPEGYVMITSGLGLATPRSILITPMITNDEIVGVVELASFQPFTPAQQTLVKKAVENLAISVVSSKITERVKRLLEESQQQTEEMKAQEEEMRQNMEELHATQEEMERKSAEAEESGRKLKAIFDSAVDAIITISDKGIIETVNESCLKMFDYSREELIGSNVSMLMPEPHHSNHNQYIHNYEKTGHAKIIGKSRIAKGLKKGGETFPVDLAVNEAFVGNHRIYIGIIRNIAEQIHLTMEKEQHEEELRQNLEELKAMQKKITEQLEENKEMRVLSETREMVLGLTTILSETDLKGRITYVNSKFCEVAKYQPDELLGKPHNIVRHPDMPKELFKLFWEVIQQGNVFKGIVKNKAKDGTPYWVDATIVPIKDDAGRIIKYTGARYHIKDEKLALMLYNKQADHFNWPRLKE